MPTWDVSGTVEQLWPNALPDAPSVTDVHVDDSGTQTKVCHVKSSTLTTDPRLPLILSDYPAIKIYIWRCDLKFTFKSHSRSRIPTEFEYEAREDRIVCIMFAA